MSLAQTQQLPIYWSPNQGKNLFKNLVKFKVKCVHPKMRGVFEKRAKCYQGRVEKCQKRVCVLSTYTLLMYLVALIGMSFKTKIADLLLAGDEPE